MANQIHLAHIFFISVFGFKSIKSIFIDKKITTGIKFSDLVNHLNDFAALFDEIMFNKLNEPFHKHTIDGLISKKSTINNSRTVARSFYKSYIFLSHLD